MIKPMLATSMNKGVITNWSDWAVEEKLDGHRIVVVVDATGAVSGWARPRGSDKRMLERDLPKHIVNELAQLPAGVYDGELLVPGHTSTDVTRLDLAGSLRYVVFDVLRQAGDDWTGLPYVERREVLDRAFSYRRFTAVSLIAVEGATCQENVTRFVDQVWGRGGEGVILKRWSAPYRPGKRSPDWIKVKKLQTTVVTVIGFEPSKGTVRFPGHPFAIVKVRDDDGHETTVKTKDDGELTQFEIDWSHSRSLAFDPTHPAIGRRLVIEYQDRTRDGGYRHPRWDRWEDE